jgi:mannose-6-phosphate isomerase
VIAGVRADEPAVFVGFNHEVDEATLAGWVRRQDTSALLGAMNRIPVSAGHTVLVPAGIPHAIGDGVFLIELQEPTDLSVLLEWEGFEVDGRRDGNLGLGFDRALACVDRSAWREEDLARLGAGSREPLQGRPGVEVLLPREADPFFRAERIRGDRGSRLPAGFSILIVTAGTGRLEAEAGGAVEVGRGKTVLVPYGAGDCRLVGPLEAVRCMPPDPDAPDLPAPAVR